MSSTRLDSTKKCLVRWRSQTPERKFTSEINMSLHLSFLPTDTKYQKNHVLMFTLVAYPLFYKLKITILNETVKLSCILKVSKTEEILWWPVFLNYPLDEIEECKFLHSNDLTFGKKKILLCFSNFIWLW